MDLSSFVVNTNVSSKNKRVKLKENDVLSWYHNIILTDIFAYHSQHLQNLFLDIVIQ